MTNTITHPPLTPQQKLEYLCAKLETLQRELEAVTSYPVSVSLSLHTFDMPDDRAALGLAADTLGFEYANYTDLAGGYWSYRLNSQNGLHLHDMQASSLTPDPLEDKTDGGLVYFADKDAAVHVDTRDEEVLGRNFTGLPPEPETSLELIQTVSAEIDDAGAGQ